MSGFVGSHLPTSTLVKYRQKEERSKISAVKSLKESDYKGDEKPEVENKCGDNLHLHTRSLPTKYRQEKAIKLHLEIRRNVSPGNCSMSQPPKRLFRIKGDGNCFFRAICYSLSGCETDHKLLRDQVVAHMSGAINKQMNEYLNDNTKDYINKSGMLDNGVWATDAEILATASLIETDIIVYGTYGLKLRWMIFPCSLTLTRLSSYALFLDNSTGNHFDVVISS